MNSRFTSRILLAQTCNEPTELITSYFSILVTVFPIILRRISPTPIGRSPGFLFRGMRRHASNGFRELCCKSEQSDFVTFASVLHRSDDSTSKLLDVKMSRQPSPSSLDDPALPLVLRADCRIRSL